MNYQTEQALKKKSDDYFNAIQPQTMRYEIEAMYDAFKARLILDLLVSGSSHQGVVYGNLENR